MANFSDLLLLVRAHAGDWAELSVADDVKLMPGRSPDMMFYVVLEGAARVVAADGGSLDLAPSDVAMVMAGQDHRLETGCARTAVAFDHFGEPHEHDVPPVLRIGEGDPAIRMLVGRIAMYWPIRLRPAGLPSCLYLRMGRSQPNTADIVDLFTRAEQGSGATAYLTKLAELAMLRMFREQIDLLSRLPPDIGSLQITRLLRLIQAKPQAPWDVASMAREIGMSRSSFAEKFVRSVGASPMMVVREARMRAAAELPETDRASVAEIGERIGYQSESAFIRRFLNQFGVSPGLYRRLSSEARRTLRVGSEAGGIADRSV